MRAQTFAAGLGLTLTFAATPALAQPGYGYEPAYSAQGGFMIDRAVAERCGLRAGAMRPHTIPAGYYEDYYDGPRRRDDGLGGALIGGAVGGVVGSRIAGRGDRTVGTIAGAAIGAVAGAAIDRAEDRDPDPMPRHGYDTVGYGDECDAVLPPGYMLVSVPGEPLCRDEVVTREEWVPEYVTVPGTPARAAPVRDKRTKLRRVK